MSVEDAAETGFRGNSGKARLREVVEWEPGTSLERVWSGRTVWIHGELEKVDRVARPAASVSGR
jgi:hypothetical protein